MDFTQLNRDLNKLKKAVATKKSNTYCLQLWSKFIRKRDAGRCVLCHSRKSLSAHHIIRKSFWNHLKFQTGNGITLCKVCHKEPHANFNRKPNLELPMDEEGGEKIDLFTGFLGALITDSKIRNIPHQEYYNFDNHSLSVFKEIQGISEVASFPGSKLEQAYQIWNQTPRGMLDAMLKSAGVTLPEDYIQDEMITMFKSDTLKNDDGSNGDVLYMRYVPPTPFKVDPTENDNNDES